MENAPLHAAPTPKICPMSTPKSHVKITNVKQETTQPMVEFRQLLLCSAGAILTLASPTPAKAQPTISELLGEASQPQSQNTIRATPEDLNPNPNPLLFPTQPDEVQTSQPQAITLKEAIEIGLRHNRDLELAKLNLERYREVLAQALSAQYATLTTQFNFQLADSINTQITGNLQLNYNIYTGGSRSAQIRASQAQVRVNLLDVERLTEQTTLDISTDYYNLQNSSAQVGIELAAVEEAALSLRDAELLERAGLGTKFDVLRAQVDLANAQQRLTLARGNERTAQRQLVERLSLGQQIDLTTADPVQVAGEWNRSLEETIILAYKNRAELEQFLLQRKIDEEQQKVQLAAIRPQISLFAQYDVLEQLADNVGPTDGLTIGAQIQWTLFDGGAARAGRNQERVDVAIAETQFANQRNEIRFEVEQAYFNLDANRKNIDTAKIAVELALESLRLARLRFQAGVGTQTDVIEAQTELTTARGNLLTSIINYNQGLAALQRAVSNLPDNRLFDQYR